MKDYIQDILIPVRHSNPNAVSIRIKAKSLSRAKWQRRHDFRIGKQPAYVDRARSHLNRPLIELRPLPQIQAENKDLREKAGRIRAMKSDAAVVTVGIITFGHIAAKHFLELTPDKQDAAFIELVQEIAARLNTKVEALVVHLDETTIHAHFMLRAYDDDGNAVSEMAKTKVLVGLQDLGALVMQRHHPKIERGHRKADRLAAGADYPETLNRSVRQLHDDLPLEIEAKQAKIEALQVEAAALEASIEKTKTYLDKLNAKAELNAKEEARLRVYEARIAKKDLEMASLEGTLREEQAELQTAKVAVELQHARLNSEGIDLVFEKRKVAKAQSDAIKAAESAVEREAEASKSLAAAEVAQAGYEAGMAAVESVVGEIFDGTMRVDDADGQITMKSSEESKQIGRDLALLQFAHRSPFGVNACKEGQGAVVAERKPDGMIARTASARVQFGKAGEGDEAAVLHPQPAPPMG
ncbi:plasmid recombination protein [Pseudorhodobacter sp. W20_MBD10_FR17]|uniref:plasmid recombination protein n=1 Tax=Pseudorhodobacter sp. W20_MBD10_FR17 TaxID=3240266 RepID=UPI003F96F26B